MLKALPRTGAEIAAELKADFSVGVCLSDDRNHPHSSISTSLKLTRSHGSITKFQPGGTPTGANSSLDLEEPFVLGYGAGRHPRETESDKPAPKNPTDSLFRFESELRDAEELLHRLDYSSHKAKGKYNPRKRLDSLKEMLSAMLPDIQHADEIEILDRRGSGAPPDQTGVHVNTPDGKVPLGQLSLGYQTVFAWTIDIAWRMLERYPDSPDPRSEAAIVLVDEIDLHLHPGWQREIRKHLTGFFPNTQFIATAHSPLMAQSSLDANLVVLRRSDDQVIIQNDPIAVPGLRLDQVITSDLYGFESARSLNVETKEKRRIELAGKPDLSPSEREELKSLDTMFGELPTAESPEDQRAMQIIREAASRLDSNRRSS